MDASGFGYVGPVHYHQLCMVFSKTRRRFFVSVYCDFEIRTEDYFLTRDRWLQKERGGARALIFAPGYCGGGE